MEGLICFCLWGLIYCWEVFGCLLGVCGEGLRRRHVFHRQFWRAGGKANPRRRTEPSEQVREIIANYNQTPKPTTPPKNPAMCMYFVCMYFVCMYVFIQY